MDYRSTDTSFHGATPSPGFSGLLRFPVVTFMDQHFPTGLSEDYWYDLSYGATFLHEWYLLGLVEDGWDFLDRSSCLTS